MARPDSPFDQDTLLLDDDLERLEEYEELRGGGSRLKLVLVSLLGFLLLAVALAGLGAVWVLRQVDPPGDPGEAVAVVIPEGATVNEIADILADNDVVSSAWVFRLYVQREDAGPFAAGDYEMRTDLSMGDAVDLLDAGPRVAETVDITVPEGFDLRQVAARTAEVVPGMQAVELYNAATDGSIRSDFQPPEVTTLEGLLFPDTYNVTEGGSESEFLQRMVDRLEEVARELGYEQAQERVGLTPYEALIVASLIEEEARVPEDRARISRVIHNRIQQGMPLQIDATVIYAMGGDPGRPLTFDDYETAPPPYNTYVVDGLPPTPIAMPGRASMEAALNPEPGNWLYYVVVDPEGRHAFATTLSEHNANIRRAEQAGVR